MTSNELVILTALRDGRTETYLLNGSAVTFGRAPDNTIILDAPNVSRYHARLEWQGTVPHLLDLGGTNGTEVDGRVIPAQVPHRLASGAQFMIGHSRFRLVVEVSDRANLEDSAGNPWPGPRAATLIHADPAAYTLEVATPDGQAEFALDADTLVLGRHPDCDIQLNTEVASRRHARLDRTPIGYEIVDLDSANGLLYQERPVYRRLLADGDVIQITRRVRMTYRIVPQAAPTAVGETIAAGPQEMPQAGQTLVARDVTMAHGIEKIDLRGRSRLTIGRDPANDLTLDYPTVSRRHARIGRSQNGAGYTIEDLQSSNGTLVNDDYIQPGRPHPLQPGNTLRIGPVRFIFAPDALEAVVDGSRHMRLDAIHLNQFVGKGINLLQDISLSVLPREFVAVVGVSGAGKSTIMNALTGFRPASDGRVLVNGSDLYRYFDAYRTEIGYVPQDDIIHRELSTEKALSYVARLRLPPDLSAVERKRLVQDELATLGLSERKNVPVGRLSGGQRKRVSIGVERLTRPGLFFLDEATSGLDPGTENQLMRLLRQLADDGQTILLITHATKNVVMCDLVLFLARGGHLAYFGPPDQALAYFGVQDFDEIYEKLQDEKSPQEWADLYRHSPQYRTYVVGRLQEKYGELLDVRSQPPAPPAQDGRERRGRQSGRPRRPSAFRQFLVLTQRYLDIIGSDRMNLLLLLLIAPVLGAMDFIAWDRRIFDPRDGQPFEVMTMLFLFSIIPFLVGALSSVREIVKERAIYLRERTVNLGIVAYLSSKVGVGFLFALYHAAALMVIKLLAVDFSHLDATGLVQQYILVVLVVMSGVMWGLLVSTLVPREEQAMLLVIVVVVLHMVFSGGILSLEQLGTSGEALGFVTSSKWAFEGFTDLNSLMQGDCESPGLAECSHAGIQGIDSEAGRAVLIDQLNERFGGVFDGSVRDSMLAMVGIVAVLFVLLVVLQKRKDVI
jgi:ABC transport system ATP-binding/permease protein